MCTKVSGRKNNKLGRSTALTSEGAFLWPPPSAVHRSDASTQENSSLDFLVFTILENVRPHYIFSSLKFKYRK